MANLTREQILNRKLGVGVATLPDGSTVAIRALTRDEVLHAQEGASTTAEREPGKAAYLLLDDDPDLEFEFYLAQKLGMTVARMRREMSNGEFMLWSRFYARKAQAEELAQLMAGG
jgi:uncharacterized protein YegP (UPF0339 family)